MRKSFLRIGDNGLVEYKCYNQQILCVIISVFGEVKGWIGMAGYDFEIILIIILGLYGKMPVLQNLEVILIGEKAFF